MLSDVIAPDLKVLFCGINPGLYSAKVGYHFAKPGNRFWKTLYLSGFTPRQYKPQEQQKLLTQGLGITNIAPRPSLSASELNTRELAEGANELINKVNRYKPIWISFLGLDAYRKAFSRKDATIGIQPEKLGSSQIWLLPNPSGLNAHYSLQDLVRLYSDLRKRIKK